MVNIIRLLVEPFNSRKSLLFISDFISVFFASIKTAQELTFRLTTPCATLVLWEANHLRQFLEDKLSGNFLLADETMVAFRQV